MVLAFGILSLVTLELCVSLVREDGAPGELSFSRGRLATGRSPWWLLPRSYVFTGSRLEGWRGPRCEHLPWSLSTGATLAGVSVRRSRRLELHLATGRTITIDGTASSAPLERRQLLACSLSTRDRYGPPPPAAPVEQHV